MLYKNIWCASLIEWRKQSHSYWFLALTYRYIYIFTTEAWHSSNAEYETIVLKLLGRPFEYEIKMCMFMMLIYGHIFWDSHLRNSSSNHKSLGKKGKRSLDSTGNFFRLVFITIIIHKKYLKTGEPVLHIVNSISQLILKFVVINSTLNSMGILLSNTSKNMIC